MNARVLVVEDEPELGQLLARGLRAEGYSVDIADNGIDAMALTAGAISSAEPYDIAVLDVMLPGMSGFELCRRLREQSEGLAVLLLTARDAVDDRVRGLDSGADDYLTKPFEFVELAARLRALRRRDAVRTSRVDIGGLLVDLTRHSVTWNGAETRLSRTEFDLIRLLADNQQRVMPRGEILETIWGSASYIEPNIVDQYVRYLRRKLDLIGSRTRIVNVRGQGFQLAGEG